MDQISLLNDHKEQHFIKLLLQKDQQSFEMLYDNYSGAIFGVILRIVKHKEIAEEALQDVFLKIWNKIDQYDPHKGRLFTWMINIARNMAIDKLRSKEAKRNQVSDTIDDIFLTVSEANHEIPNSDLIGLKDLLSYLDEKDSFIISMLYFQGHSQSELAKDFDIPLGTVKTRTRRGLKQLRSIINL